MSRAERWLVTKIGSADLPRLLCQGFVAADRLPSGRLAYKLRYRAAGGRQRVVYLGVDGNLAAEVKTVLEGWQSRSRRLRELHRLEQLARQTYRDWRDALSPALAHHGYKFHGVQIRRRRRSGTIDREASPAATPTTR